MCSIWIYLLYNIFVFTIKYHSERRPIFPMIFYHNFILPSVIHFSISNNKVSRTNFFNTKSQNQFKLVVRINSHYIFLNFFYNFPGFLKSTGNVLLLSFEPQKLTVGYRRNYPQRWKSKQYYCSKIGVNGHKKKEKTLHNIMVSLTQPIHSSLNSESQIEHCINLTAKSYKHFKMLFFISPCR